MSGAQKITRWIVICFNNKGHTSDEDEGKYKTTPCALTEKISSLKINYNKAITEKVQNHKRFICNNILDHNCK